MIELYLEKFIKKDLKEKMALMGLFRKRMNAKLHQIVWQCNVKG